MLGASPFLFMKLKILIMRLNQKQLWVRGLFMRICVFRSYTKLACYVLTDSS